MKPNFALHFTDTSIALLHRTAKGWQKVGETPFDAPDLDDALDYLRRTALGLEPSGLVTKLIIPNSQILYTQIDSDAPTEAERRSEMAYALEYLTPYKAEELVFDYSGDESPFDVAALAIETLGEAYEFAAKYQFNPVSFVAMPEPEKFDGEPWFGLTKDADRWISEGDKFERDTQTVNEPIAQPAPIAVPTPPPMVAKTGPSVTISSITPVMAAVPALQDIDDSQPAEVEVEVEVAPPQAIVDLPDDSVPLSDDAYIEADLDEDEPLGLPFGLTGQEIQVKTVQEPPVANSAAAIRPFLPPALQPEYDEELALLEPLPPLAPMMSRVNAPAPMPEPEPELLAPPMPVFAPAPITPEIAAPISQPPAARAALAPAPVAPPISTPIPVPVVPVAQEAPAPAPLSAPPSLSASPSERLVPRPEPRQNELRIEMRKEPVLSAAPAFNTAPKLSPRPAEPTFERPVAPPSYQPHALAKQPPAPSLARPAPYHFPDLSEPEPASQYTQPTPPPVMTPAPLVAPALKRPVSQPLAPPPQEALESLAHSAYDLPPEPKKKSYYLAFILVAILLLALALVAAWSSIYLASAPEAAPKPTSQLAQVEPAVSPLEPAQAAGFIAETEIDAPILLAQADIGTSSGEIPNDEVFFSAGDAPPPSLNAQNLPIPQNLVEISPETPMPPPPVGTVYQFDAQGLIVPQLGGISSPDGYTIFQGKPQKTPPTRPDLPADSAETEAISPSEIGPQPQIAQSEPEHSVITASTAGLTPNPLMGAAASTLSDLAAIAPKMPDDLVLAAANQQPNPDLADKRPKLRPETLTPPTLAPETTPEDSAKSQSAADASMLATLAFNSIRPVQRPDHLLKNLPPETLEDDQDIDLASTSGSLLNISRRPAARPQGLIVPQGNSAVDATAAATLRAPPAPAAPTNAQRRSAAIESHEEDELNEPEYVATAAPKIPTKANVAQNATYAKAINLSKLNLIGIYGSQANRHALVRQSNGSFKKVKVGDKIDGGQIKAITQTEVRYQKGGRLLALTMPQG